MALITIASSTTTAGVISGTIIMPKIGVWQADLVVDQPDGTGFAAGTRVSISTGQLTLAGVVAPARTGDFLDTVYVRVLGGAGGMASISKPRSFVQPGAFVRDVLNGLIVDSGETLSSTVDAGFLAGNLAAWSTMNKSVSWNLRALLKIQAPSFSWRILPDGTLWMGVETWPSSSGIFDIIEQTPAEGQFVLGSETPFITPGMSLPGVGNVNRVEHQVSRKKIRSTVSVDLPDGDRGLQSSIARMVATQTAGFDFFGAYVCQVVSQSADLTTVDIQFQGANKPKLAGLQRVPVRAGTGIKIQFSPGATAVLQWDSGNPQIPFVSLGASKETALAIQLGGIDPVLTKADMTALIAAITTMATTGNSGGPLSFTAPTQFGSTVVGAGR